MLSHTHSLSLLPTDLSHCSHIIQDHTSTQLLLPNHHVINHTSPSSHMTLSSRRSYSRYPQSTTSSTNGYHHTMNGYSPYCTLPRLSTRNQQNGRLPTPAARPTLGQQMLTYDGTRETLESLEKFTQGTNIFRFVINVLNHLELSYHFSLGSSLTKSCTCILCLSMVCFCSCR